MASIKRQPLASFGIITDIQYADIRNGANYKKDQIRYYRNSVNILKDAVDQWNTSEHPVDFVLQLGDIIDGQNNKTPGASMKSLNKVLEVLSELNCPRFHTIGNHELYNFQRGILGDTELYSCRDPTVTSCNDPHRSYYHFSPVAGFRIIVLDTFDISVIGIDKQSREYQDTMNMLQKYKDDETPQNNSEPDRSMYLSMNGGVSERQLIWLDEVLSQAEKSKERVIVAGHVPIHPESAAIRYICWNHANIRATLQRHQACVLAYISGHDHNGGYAKDELGISYITFHGVIEAPPGISCFATVHVYHSEVIIQGSGVIPSYTLT